MRCQWGTTWDNMQPWIVARRYREFDVLNIQVRSVQSQKFYLTNIGHLVELVLIHKCGSRYRCHHYCTHRSYYCCISHSFNYHYSSSSYILMHKSSMSSILLFNYQPLLHFLPFTPLIPLTSFFLVLSLTFQSFQRLSILFSPLYSILTLYSILFSH